MIECLLLLVAMLHATVRDRGDLVAENLLLRQQLAVVTRSTRKRPGLRARHKLFWVLARLVRRDWRRLWGLKTRSHSGASPEGCDRHGASPRCLDRPHQDLWEIGCGKSVG
jgi:hypothetical protein